MDAASALELTIAIMTVATMAYGGYRWLHPRVLVPFGEVVGALIRLPALEEKLDAVVKEVTPNHGSSLRDAITRTELAVEDIRNRQHVNEAEARALSDSDPSVARFTSGEDGGNTQVSATYCRWLNVSKGELIGWRFLSFVHPEDRERVRATWNSARLDRRVHHDRYRMQSSAGEIITVDVVIMPIPEDGPVQHWTGVMRRLDRGSTDR